MSLFFSLLFSSLLFSSLLFSSLLFSSLLFSSLLFSSLLFSSLLFSSLLFSSLLFSSLLFSSLLSSPLLSSRPRCSRLWRACLTCTPLFPPSRLQVHVTEASDKPTVPPVHLHAHGLDERGRSAGLSAPSNELLNLFLHKPLYFLSLAKENIRDFPILEV
jgi:hypothetical protein